MKGLGVKALGQKGAATERKPPRPGRSRWGLLALLAWTLGWGGILSPGEPGLAEEPLRHAALFSVEERPEGILVTNRIPWPGATEEMAWLLQPAASADALPGIPGARRVRVPVSRVVVTSMPAVACMEALGALDALVGVGGGRYCYSPAARARAPVEVGPAEGMGAAFDVERLMALSPDVVFAYAYTAEERAGLDRLEALGIPVVLASEFLEETPLGRAEWIRFFALFLGRQREAEEFFDQVDRHYQRLRLDLASVDHRPRVMAGTPLAGSWHVLGKESWLGLLIDHAGGSYVWGDIPGRRAVYMDAEAIFAKGAEADLWIHCGLWLSREQALREEPRAALFRPFREHAVWNNDARSFPGGGNDFYEGGALRPDRILEDLALIFHPERFPGGTPFYYRPLLSEDRR